MSGQFTITTTQTKEDKARGYIFLQTQKNPNRTYSANTCAGRWSLPSPYPMKLRIIRLKLSTGEYETLTTSLPTWVTANQVKALYHARMGYQNSIPKAEIRSLCYAYPQKKRRICPPANLFLYDFSNFFSKIIRRAVIQHWKHRKLHEVNRKMAGYLCREFLRNPGADGEQLLRDISKYIVPVKPGQQNPRNLRAQSWRVLVIVCQHRQPKMKLFC